MELKEWKDIERGAKSQIRDAEVQKTIGLILLDKAIDKIRELGGKTIEEEEEEFKRKAKKYTG